MTEEAKKSIDESQKELDGLKEKYRIHGIITQEYLDSNYQLQDHAKVGDPYTENPPVPSNPLEAFELFKNYYARVAFTLEKMEFIRKYGRWEIAYIENEIKDIEDFSKAALLIHRTRGNQIYESNKSFENDLNKKEIEYLRLRNGYYRANLMTWEHCQDASNSAIIYGRYFLFYDFLIEKLKEYKLKLYNDSVISISPFIQLDEVLKCLATNPFVIPFVTDAGLCNELAKLNTRWNSPYAILDLHRILHKLEKEGNLIKEIRPDERWGNTANYRISFDGKLFSAQGGYVGQSEKDEIKRKQEELTIQHQKELQENQRQMMQLQTDNLSKQTTALVKQTDIQKTVQNLTKWIALGTIAGAIAATVAAIYYILEIIKLEIPSYFNFPLIILLLFIASIGGGCLMLFLQYIDRTKKSN